MPQLIDGKKISAEIKEELKHKVEKMKEKGQNVCLTVVQVGEDVASSIYVRNKEKACTYIGIESRLCKLPEETSEEKLLDIIHDLNEDSTVNGILVQLPLPDHIDEKKVIEAISLEKDVDGFHPQSLGNLCNNSTGFQPCTPSGIIELLKRSDITISGKHCVVMGRSNIVGKPAALLLLRENGTVTVVHSKSENVKELTRQADILVVAVGIPKYVNSDFVKENAVVVDVGMHRDSAGKLCGDVDFEDVKDKVSAITPVPGGVGPMTIAMLMKNCIHSAEFQEVVK